jgi:hypothetical protein
MATVDGQANHPSLGAADTAREIEDLEIQAYRRMSGLEKLEAVRRLNRIGLTLALADIRAHHPDANERECLLRLASRCVEPEILRRFCGWDVRVEGY